MAVFISTRHPPGVDQADFAPRLKTPVLMVNGKYDFVFSVGEGTEPAVSNARLTRCGQTPHRPRIPPRRYRTTHRTRARRSRLARQVPRSGRMISGIRWVRLRLRATLWAKETTAPSLLVIGVRPENSFALLKVEVQRAAADHGSVGRSESDQTPDRRRDTTSTPHDHHRHSEAT